MVNPLSFSKNAGYAPRFEQTRATPGAKMAKLKTGKLTDQLSTLSRCRRNTTQYYLTRVRRRWIKTINTTTAKTPHPIWMIVVVSTSIPPSLND
ncbi:MAG: hypothetical protein ABSB30_12835 [Terracidiphilus sp.]|jgi:hypothetical protein